MGTPPRVCHVESDFAMAAFQHAAVGRLSARRLVKPGGSPAFQQLAESEAPTPRVRPCGKRWWAISTAEQNEPKQLPNEAEMLKCSQAEAEGWSVLTS